MGRLREEAERELLAERFREAVVREKARIRAHRPWWRTTLDRIINLWRKP